MLKTASGFECTVDSNVLDDIEIVDIFVEVDEGNPVHIGKAAEKMLGKEQKAKLYEHVRTDDGRVPITAVCKELAEVVDLLGGKK